MKWSFIHWWQQHFCGHRNTNACIGHNKISNKNEIWGQVAIYAITKNHIATRAKTCTSKVKKPQYGLYIHIHTDKTESDLFRSFRDNTVV